MIHLKKQSVSLLSVPLLVLVLTLASPNSARAQDPAVTAFQDDENNVSANSAVNFQVQFSIPSGKRLVIERLSAHIDIPHNVKINSITLGTTVNNSPAGYLLPKAVLDFNTGMAPGTDHYSLFVAPNLYADGGKVNFIVTLSQSSKAGVGATISGHLVCPQNLVCLKSAQGSSNAVDDRAAITATTCDTTVVAQTRPRFAMRAIESTTRTLAQRLASKP
jgi:hypothetical protein